ncbi:hypothetical protein F4777DRAFT_535947 [Nemania sp. FL0916]|nr:hypothetical protein F4777DRAFT_535947 [Nemania sp. FL0916]
MAELSIHTAIHSRYQVLDASGQLPFSVVFGLCRRSPADTDPRPLVLHTSSSILDVPYAISEGLLTLHEQQDRDSQSTQISLPHQSETSGSGAGEYLTLSSPVGRTGSWREAFTIYQYFINPESKLASVLQPGKKYTIRAASGDLGVKWWAYGDVHHPPDKQGALTKSPETTKLVNSKPTAGKASFAVVPELSWPPKVETHMQLRRNEQTGGDEERATFLEISFLNRGTKPIVVQTRGTQNFIVPWGPFQPEDVDMNRSRVIDSFYRGTSLRVLDAATSEVVIEPKKMGPCGPLTSASADRRPKLEILTTVMPGQPIIKHVDITELLTRLPDGKYHVLMVPQGMWWCPGRSEGIADEGDDRVPQRLYQTRIPPLMLETDDFVELEIENGRAVL